MTKDRYAPRDRVAIPELAGLTIKTAWYDETDNGYPYVRLELTDGTFFTVEESGQTGSIGFARENK